MDIPVALNAPTSDFNFLTEELIQEAIELSRISPRKRIILPLHKGDGERLHRMFNVVQPGTYIRPHTHEKSGKSESIVVLKGAIRVIIFDQSGKILEHKNLTANSFCFGFDLEPNVIHSFIALEPDTVIYEVKPGPYDKELDKGFMPWAPEEFSPEAKQYLDQITELTQQ